MKIISSDLAPAAIGPYSQAVKAGCFLFCSGQIALDCSGAIREFDVEGQTECVMSNLLEVLKESGLSFDDVVKTTIYLRDMEDFKTVNEVYAKSFQGDHKPARATVEVSRLPKDVLVEIDCVAFCG